MKICSSRYLQKCTGRIICPVLFCIWMQLSVYFYLEMQLGMVFCLSFITLLQNNKYLLKFDKKLLTFKKTYAILWKRQNETAFQAQLISANYMRRI